MVGGKEWWSFLGAIGPLVQRTSEPLESLRGNAGGKAKTERMAMTPAEVHSVFESARHAALDSFPRQSPYAPAEWASIWLMGWDEGERQRGKITGAAGSGSALWARAPLNLNGATGPVGGRMPVEDEPVVTEEMRTAGLRVWRSAKDDFEHSDIDAIYRAMAAVAPISLAKETEGQLFVDRQEILMLQGSLAWRDDRIAELTKPTEECARMGVAQLEEIALLHKALAAKDARIAELDSMLTLKIAAFVDPEPAPARPHNPFAPSTDDPRRMGARVRL